LEVNDWQEFELQPGLLKETRR